MATGTFGPPSRIDGGGGNAQAPIVVADLNNDGIPDLVFGDGSPFGDGAISVLIGKGDGTFNPETNYELPHTGAVTSLVVTDLNKDGMPDIAAANEGLSVFLNNGDGTFRVTQTNPSFASLVKAADLNRDGKLDLLLLEPSSGLVEALIGNGDGTFSGGGLLFQTGGSYPTDMAVIDLNKDARPDVLVANSDQDGSIGVLLNNKTFFFKHTATTLASSLNPSIYGQTTTLTAVVTAASRTPTGTVAFVTAEGYNTIGSANLVNGKATLAVSTPGSSSIIAAYQGSENFAASNSTPLMQVVQKATTTTSLSSSHNPAKVGQTVMYTPSVQSQYGGAVGGTITLYDGAAIIGSLQIGGKKSRVMQKYTAPGTHVITAVYSGDEVNFGSTSSPLSERVVGQTTVVVSSSGSPSQVGQPVTFTATVTSEFGTIPDGELVTFLDGSEALGSSSISAGSATYTTSTLKARTHTIKVVYPGDSSFATSLGSVVQIVEP